MSTFKPPQNIAIRNHNRPSVFLAGSITDSEKVKGEYWQDKVAEFFEYRGYDVFNPRREDWDSTWIQEFTNPQFFQQVTWELNGLEQADLIIMYFDPSTKSPISLLELGLFARSEKIKVVCPDGFWRKGNVEVICNLYNIPLYNSLEVLFLDLHTYI
jgi:hypothetical protein